MAKPPPDPLAGFDPAFQSPTLFLPAPGKSGILVKKLRGRRAAEPLQFPSAAAALQWCQRRRVNLVYFHSSAQGN
jgi:hypothetical protein